MVLGGFNKKLLDDLGVNYRCLVNEQQSFRKLKEKGITGSMAAVEYAAKVDGPKTFLSSECSNVHLQGFGYGRRRKLAAGCSCLSSSRFCRSGRIQAQTA